MNESNNSKKADYDQIAATYDLGRKISDQALEILLNFFVATFGARTDIKLLDLGCGTGRFTIPIAYELGYTITGTDKSSEMIAQAKAKTDAKNIIWDVQDANKLSYKENQFDAVLLSHLLHHIDNPLAVIKECYRVLNPGGMLINRYGAMEDIIDDPEHRFFPEAIEIDKTRTPSKLQVERWFKEAGFIDIISQTKDQITNQTGEERLVNAMARCSSVLWLISPTAFEKGVENFKAYLASHRDDPWLLVNKMTITSGKKLSQPQDG